MAKEVDETASVPEIIDAMREATERFFEVAFKVVEDLKVDVQRERNSK